MDKLTPIPITMSYPVAWKAYTVSNDYVVAVQEMWLKGMKQPYIDNILKCAFDAGWNSPKQQGK